MNPIFMIATMFPENVLIEKLLANVLAYYKLLESGDKELLNDLRHRIRIDMMLVGTKWIKEEESEESIEDLLKDMFNPKNND